MLRSSLALLLAACAAPRPAPHPPPTAATRPRAPAPPCPPPPTTASAGSAPEIARGGETPPPALTPGRWYVRRIAHGDGPAWSSAGSERTVRRSWVTQCEELDVVARGSVTIELAGATLQLDDGLLRGLRLAARGSDPIAGACVQPFAVTGRSEGRLETTLGPIFEDRESCREVPSNVTETCGGGECTFDEAGARPFLLGACEAELRRLGRLASLLDAEHPAIERTWRRVEAIRGRAVPLWERTESECVAVTLRDTDEGLELRSRHERDDGARVERHTVVRFEPLHHRAFVVRDDITRSFPGDGVHRLGAPVHGQHLSVLFGDGVMLLDDRPMFLRRASCELFQP